jgi:hypothetical protein
MGSHRHSRELRRRRGEENHRATHAWHAMRHATMHLPMHHTSRARLHAHQHPWRSLHATHCQQHLPMQQRDTRALEHAHPSQHPWLTN